ncbi:SDR family oxidoreductase [Compostibacter hankyongensis]|uniref:SDR family oxidoreductase n=1 Tax=Compostibacter hankyongensis TaxID=1007089 RepID=A0ABP8FD68_9BACT
MDLDLKNKNAWVGGSSSGLGLATAIELSLLGAAVTLCGRNEDALKAALGQLDTGAGQRHGYLRMDFSEGDACRKAFAQLAAERPLHILINNTGGPPPGAAFAAAPEQYRDFFEMQLVNFQAFVQAAVPAMKAAAYGRIVNITSTSTKAPIAGLGISNVVRAAVANWGKSLATELGPYGITVNNVLPGSHDTERLKELYSAERMQEAISRIPAGRLGQPREFGAVVAFLCTPAASFINGVNLPADGGQLGGL